MLESSSEQTEKSLLPLTQVQFYFGERKKTMRKWPGLCQRVIHIIKTKWNTHYNYENIILYFVLTRQGRSFWESDLWAEGQEAASQNVEEGIAGGKKSHCEGSKMGRCLARKHSRKGMWTRPVQFKKVEALLKGLFWLSSTCTGRRW